ncbi:hypothetical protein KR018_001870, partial [Drosophila ironensis]
SQMNSSVTIERKRVDVLPKGWQRDEPRKTGASSAANTNNKADVFYYSHSAAGKRAESRRGDELESGTPDAAGTTGKLEQRPQPSPSISLYRCSVMPQPLSGGGGSGSGAPALKRKYARSHLGQESGAGAATAIPAVVAAAAAFPNTAASPATAGNPRQQLELSRALRTDVSLVPPIRQTASIFKQPVTAISNHSQEHGVVKHDAKHGSQEKPKQLFWEKRLERLRACHDNGEELDDISLPKTIRTVGPNVNEQTVLQSVATALHMLNAGVHGQSSTKADLTKNAMAFMNPEQPLMHAVIISEDDIRKQEDRVGVARRKLQDALKT